MELEVGSKDQITFEFLTPHQKIISSFLRILSDNEDLTPLLGEKIVCEIQTKIDPEDGGGCITGSPGKMSLLLRLFAETNQDVSLVFDASSFDRNNEDYQFFCLFEGLVDKVSVDGETEMSFRDMISANQRTEVIKAFASYDAQLPYIFRLEDEFEVFPSLG